MVELLTKWAIEDYVGWMKLVGMLAVAGLLVAGCGDASEEKPKVFDVRGQIVLSNPSGILATDGSCIGDDGYDDMREGADVTIYDADGSKVALGDLESGTTIHGVGTCTFNFTVNDVPSGGRIYSIEVSHRGQTSFKPAEAKDLALTLS